MPHFVLSVDEEIKKKLITTTYKKTVFHDDCMETVEKHEFAFPLRDVMTGAEIYGLVFCIVQPPTFRGQNPNETNDAYLLFLSNLLIPFLNIKSKHGKACKALCKKCLDIAYESLTNGKFKACKCFSKDKQFRICTTVQELHYAIKKRGNFRKTSLVLTKYIWFFFFVYLFFFFAFGSIFC